MEATHIYVRVPAHIHTHIHIHTHSHTHTHTYTETHTRTHTHKQGVELHILVSSISSEDVVYHHSDAIADWDDCSSSCNFIKRLYSNVDDTL